MDDPQGRTLLLDFPITEGDAVQPAFRFFIDWAARFALADDQDTYFVLDEFARLPGLRKIGDLINAGRGRNATLARCAVGRTTPRHLRERPGERAVEWPRQSVIMRVGDAASVEYAQSQIGREKQRRSVLSTTATAARLAGRNSGCNPSDCRKRPRTPRRRARRSSSPMAGFAA